jgi:translation elongation factor EF-Ts
MSTTRRTRHGQDRRARRARIDRGADVLEPLGKQLAMHVAAANPLALNGDDLDADLVARERAIAEEKAAQSGKPADIVSPRWSTAASRSSARKTRCCRSCS